MTDNNDNPTMKQALTKAITEPSEKTFLIGAMLPKIAQARRLVSAAGLELRIQIDGGVTAQTIERAAEAGADVFVAGSAVYRADDALGAITSLRDLAAGGC